MIYEAVDSDAPLRQGDIFTSIPFPRTPLAGLLVRQENGELASTDWEAVADTEDPIGLCVFARARPGIVLTPNCDALRSELITLAEVCPFPDVEGRAKTIQNPRGATKVIAQQAKINRKWFYLPPDDLVGFDGRMAVDFRSVVTVPRVDLEGFRKHRTGRLGAVAGDHFRERLSEFYRQYTFNEWYSFNKEEFDYYRDLQGDEFVKPYPWQV